jgi:uncharacterized membrane protein
VKPLAKHLGGAPALRGRRRLRAGIVQLIYVLAAVALGLVVPRIPIEFTVSSGRAIDSLLAVGAGIVAFIGIVYSLLFLVVQFGSTAFTPRLNLFRDAPIVWHAFGFFTGVLVFSFTAAFSIGTDEQTSGLVPISLVVALVATIAVFRALQAGAFESVQLASTLAQVTKRGREVIDGVYPEKLRAGADVPVAAAELSTEGHEVIWSGVPAVLQVIDLPRLVRSAEHADVTIELRAVPGETIFEGSVVGVVHGRRDDGLDPEILGALAMGVERTFEQDPAFALRILADIALRALSPAVNDPTTAVQALDGLDSLLRRLGGRELAVGPITDANGNLRVVVYLPSWEEYVGLALDEIISSGLTSLQVGRRLARLLEDVAALAPPQRRAAVMRRLTLVRASIDATQPAGLQADPTT